MTTNPSASIIVPTYNNETYLPQLIDSIRAQTSDDFEVIIVNDGSTDDTGAIANAARTSLPRCTVINQKNSGPGVARNTGLSAAQGDYVLFLDADDWISPKTIEHLLQRARDTQADIVIYKMRLYDLNDELYHPLPDQWDAGMLKSTFAPVEYADTLFDTFKNWPPDKLFRKQFLEENAIRFPALYRTEDMPFTCLALACARKIALVDEELYTYRVNNAQSSTQNLDKAPLDFYRSSLMLKTELERRGLYETYYVAFGNWISLCIMVNMLGLSTPQAFLQVYETMHSKGIHALGLDAFAEENYSDLERYDFIQVLLHDDAATGAFKIWHDEIVRLEKRHEEEIAKITDSTSFRLGSTLIKPATFLKDQTSNRRKKK